MVSESEVSGSEIAAPSSRCLAKRPIDTIAICAKKRARIAKFFGLGRDTVRYHDLGLGWPRDYGFRFFSFACLDIRSRSLQGSI